MAELYSVEPGRGRAGNTLTLTGEGFAPASPGNSVKINGVAASIVTQDEFEIVVTVPVGFTDTDQWALVAVRRIDTGDFASLLWWGKASAAQLQLASRILEALPGALEATDLTFEGRLQTMTARDWHRLVTFAEFLTLERLSAAGSLFVREAAGPRELLVGPDGRQLEANIGEASGLKWSKPRRYFTLPWGRETPSGLPGGTMIANASPDVTTVSELAASCGIPAAGTVEVIWVTVDQAGGGDTLNQVQLRAGTPGSMTVIYDSGGGLGLAQGEAHQAVVDAYVGPADTTIFISAVKAGTSALMRLSGSIRLLQELRPGDAAVGADDTEDAVLVTDSIETEFTLGAGSIDDAAVVVDELVIDFEADLEAVLPTDAAQVTDEIAIALDIASPIMEGPTIDLQDTIETELS